MSWKDVFRLHLHLSSKKGGSITPSIHTPHQTMIPIDPNSTILLINKTIRTKMNLITKLMFFFNCELLIFVAKTFVT